ncbi:MAG: hypothetical protein OJF49_002903 [Ktedonobacterales bacterium]|jgi:hypothetical protein|nr:MAG: hypothetical protein OJF49_002903 [Ktedonobacterales bacterium]
MTWADLEWPDLSPAFPEPRPSMPAPVRPDAPADVAQRVRRAERQRGVFVPLCILAGAAIFGVGIALYASRPGLSVPLGALALLLAGLLVATLLPALVVLLVIGPTWPQRQQHYALLRWQAEHAAWLARERERYMAALPADARTAFAAMVTDARADRGSAREGR